MAFVLTKEPGNNLCADCCSANPRWASVNLGILICIECSGVHRSLGTHISQVRSLTLDQWTQEQLENCMKVGNLKANKYWEARMPLNFKRPSPHSRTALEHFIRTKYVEKKWVAPDESAKNSKTSAPPTPSVSEKPVLKGAKTSHENNRTCNLVDLDDPFADAFTSSVTGSCPDPWAVSHKTGPQPTVRTTALATEKYAPPVEPPVVANPGVAESRPNLLDDFWTEPPHSADAPPPVSSVTNTSGALVDEFVKDTAVSRGLKIIDESLKNAPPVELDALTAAIKQNLDVFK